MANQEAPKPPVVTRLTNNTIFVSYRTGDVITHWRWYGSDRDPTPLKAADSIQARRHIAKAQEKLTNQLKLSL